MKKVIRNKKKFDKNILITNIKDSNILMPDDVIKTWENGFLDKIQRDVSDDGLRLPQFGALSAIRSRWTIKNDPITIVLPTGTGKTETMLATIVSEKIKRTLIIVPSDLLRTQIFKKAKEFGVLYKSGNLKESVLKPNVLLLKSRIKDLELFIELINSANIIITTMSFTNKLSEDYKNKIINSCSVLIVDEAHHISSKTWSNFKGAFRGKRILQFTATPFREDGKKVDGDVIYNFPLRLAQEQGYFQEIIFDPVEEFSEEKQDEAIAKRAVEVLRRDIANGFNHTLLVRASNVKRATQLYKDIYLKKYSNFNPVLMTNKVKGKERKKRMEMIKSTEAKIVVCVDMFGEGIDIPNLKIAAIHDKYKSIPITLQFVGRFARTHDNLGNATIVTNIADENISEALEDMYKKDSDWNKILRNKTKQYIDTEIKLQEMSNNFSGEAIEKVNIANIRPKVSMIAHMTYDENWNWENWRSVFDESNSYAMVNEEENILTIIERRESSVSWTNQQDISDLNWNLYIVYWNKEKNIVFVNSSDRSKGFELAKSIFDTEISTIKNEIVFRCLYGIKRLALGTVGLNSRINGPIRYKMFAGIDIAQGISESNKSNSFKSNVFGIGYNGNGKISIGCSHKGVIWSRWVESILFWKNWCNQIIDKVLDELIDVNEILKGVLTPKVITKRPKEYAYRIDWPDELEFETNKKIIISNIAGDFNLDEVDISIINENFEKDILEFEVSNSMFFERFKLSFGENDFYIYPDHKIMSRIKIGNKEKDLYKYFKENPPIIWFADGASLEGNVLVELSNKAGAKFPEDNIITWDWNELGVNISVESQWDKLLQKRKKNRYSML
ncbi:DEAD/DEAH box helicase [Clostridium cochlearium]|uniref:DEAD/DEAH box helicase n=1 Tax=Clostridium cochlearium TaxID=1494 RepID=UPI00156DF336|nr:DEAD/DEAH box helicase family protein [Clostridium cochlearium]MBV1818113.1 DEAD/DEAH box helicase family protein [Bacteroidales bacterium MSK.15.36]MCG4580065.1 DEAD/DEAH box helicase family protein [Clostridium cochlearium]NSJ90911.1 DEAD/DEAH box helicase family protein [Coprococcus sp. MSK.21.13]